MKPTFNANLPEATLPPDVSDGTPTELANDTSPGVKPPDPQLSWPRVESGAKGERVRTIQYSLRHHGYSLEIDAVFGKKTEAAVIAFEKKHGIPAHGVVDDREWVALLTRLKEGASGWSVQALQSQLRESGYAIKVDGDFGELTEKAVRSFQRANKLPVNGVVDYATWNKLVEQQK